jgi:hypothetical protein
MRGPQITCGKSLIRLKNPNKEQLLAAIHAVGPMVKDVRRKLGK